MKKLLFLGSAVLLGLVVLVAGSKLYTGSQRDAIYEAVVREFANPAQNLALPKDAHIFFVQMEKQDPSPEFLARFNGAPFSVRKYSQSGGTSSPFSGHVAYDAATREPGVAIKLSRITWYGPDHVIAWAGADGYEMKKDGGLWRIHNHLMTVAF